MTIEYEAMGIEHGATSHGATSVEPMVLERGAWRMEHGARGMERGGEAFEAVGGEI